MKAKTTCDPPPLPVPCQLVASALHTPCWLVEALDLGVGRSSPSPPLGRRRTSQPAVLAFYNHSTRAPCKPHMQHPHWSSHSLDVLQHARVDEAVDSPPLQRHTGLECKMQRPCQRTTHSTHVKYRPLVTRAIWRTCVCCGCPLHHPQCLTHRHVDAATRQAYSKGYIA